MTLITLLIALTIERISATADIWQFPFYYQKLKDVVFKHMGNPSWLESSVGRWFILIIPIIIVWFLSSVIDWLLIEFIFNLVVLLICIGCLKQRQWYKSFLNAAKRGDDSAANIYKAQLCGYIESTSSNTDETPEPEQFANADKADTPTSKEAPVVDAIPTPVNGQITDAVEGADTMGETIEDTIEKNCAGPCGIGQSIVWLNFRYYCAILFWFVMAGPTGAVTYCMVREAADDGDERLRQILPQDQLKTILHWLDWIPARVCSAGYLLIGNFTRAASVWVGYLLDFTSPAKALVTDIAEAAEMVDKDDMGKAGEAVRMLKLAKRNVLFFLALVALLTLYGGVR